MVTKKLLLMALACTWPWMLQSCATRSGPATYRLLSQNDERILIPPGVKDASVSRRTLDFRTAADARSCGGNEGGVELQTRRRGRVRLTVQRDVLQQQPAGWLAHWAASLEERGCIAPGEGFGLATRVAQAVPLELPVEQRLLNQDARSSGYTDLRPGYKLRVVSPVFREGAPPDAVAIGEGKVTAAGAGLTVELRASPDLIGYETAWYAVQPRARGGGAQIVPEFAEFHSEDEVTRQNEPRADYLAFDPAMAYFRMLFMARRTESSDHDIFVLAAATQAKIEERTRALETGAETCSVATSQSACITAPKQVAIVAFLRVTVQGKEVLVHPGAILGNALHEASADNPQQVLPTLVVRKPFEGRLAQVEFPRTTLDILALPLSGGEEICW